MGNVNTNSPLLVDKVVTEAIQAYCGAGQGIVVAPFILSGAMGPVSTAASIAQALAEAMMCCAYSQLVRPRRSVCAWKFSLFGKFKIRRAHLRHAGASNVQTTLSGSSHDGLGCRFVAGVR